MKTNISECIIIKKIFLPFVSFPPYTSAITSYAFVCVCVCVCVLKCFPNIFSFKFPTVWHVETNYVCECTKTDRSLRQSFKETTKKRKCVLQSCRCFFQMFSWRFLICHCQRYLFIARANSIVVLAKMIVIADWDHNAWKRMIVPLGLFN